MARDVVIVDHPLILHKLSLMRDKDCSSSGFRRLVREVSMLLTYEVTRDLPITHRTLETPLQTMEAPVLEGRKLVLVAILRAGVGLLDGMLEVMPSARVGHIGMARDPKTLEAHEYYLKLPSHMAERDALLLDPMLATGNTAIASTTRLEEAGCRSLKLVCLLAAPEGIAAFHDVHPDVPVFTAAVDERLNEKGYILPGLGDAGDRIFGTK